jgi:hypothetical protein
MINSVLLVLGFLGIFLLLVSFSIIFFTKAPEPKEQKPDPKPTYPADSFIVKLAKDLGHLPPEAPDWSTIREEHRCNVLRNLIEATNMAMTTGAVSRSAGQVIIDGFVSGRHAAARADKPTDDMLLARHFGLDVGEKVISVAVETQDGQIEIRPYA